MTNEKEAPEWWMDDEYWEEGMDYKGYYSYDPKIEKIVAEAMRRGEVKAWSELVEIVEQSENPFPKEMLGAERGYYHIFENFRSIVLRQVDKKRKELKTS